MHRFNFSSFTYKRTEFKRKGAEPIIQLIKLELIFKIYVLVKNSEISIDAYLYPFQLLQQVVFPAEEMNN